MALDAGTCPRSVAEACSDPNSSPICPASWQEALSDRSNCGKDVYFTESTWSCPEYNLLWTQYVDWGRHFIYDKSTGELVAVLSWNGNSPALSGVCLGGPADWPGAGDNALAGCTKLGDCQTQPDGGQTEPDGGQTQPDGRQTQPDGGQIQPEGGAHGGC